MGLSSRRIGAQARNKVYLLRFIYCVNTKILTKQLLAGSQIKLALEYAVASSWRLTLMLVRAFNIPRHQKSLQINPTKPLWAQTTIAAAPLQDQFEPEITSLSLVGQLVQWPNTHTNIYIPAVHMSLANVCLLGKLLKMTLLRPRTINEHTTLTNKMNECPVMM